MKTSGWGAILAMPRIAITVNQIAITGPKSLPTSPVPKRCSANSATSTATVIGTTRSPMPGVATFSPSTAESTEMAGVITPSP